VTTCREALTSWHFSFFRATALIHLEQDGGISNHASKNRDYRERDVLNNLVRRHMNCPK